ncbi:hypothetical protein [Streptomyces sp. NPDC006551]|uniref:hypothetical protein n=1 Tax=Streptomyces sp. NPDC006551 TaxID=3157178 RepID=UPI0033A138B6
MTWIAAAAFVLYLAGIGGLAHLWPYVIRRDARLQLATDVNPIAVSLLLALVTVAWPGTLPAAALATLTRRTR